MTTPLTWQHSWQGYTSNVTIHPAWTFLQSLRVKKPLNPYLKLKTIFKNFSKEYDSHKNIFLVDLTTFVSSVSHSKLLPPPLHSISLKLIPRWPTTHHFNATTKPITQTKWRLKAFPLSSLLLLLPNNLPENDNSIYFLVQWRVYENFIIVTSFFFLSFLLLVRVLRISERNPDWAAHLIAIDVEWIFFSLGNRMRLLGCEDLSRTLIGFEELSSFTKIEDWQTENCGVLA